MPSISVLDRISWNHALPISIRHARSLHSQPSFLLFSGGRQKSLPLPPVDLLPAVTFSWFPFPENLLVRFSYADGCHFFFPPPSLSPTHLYLALIPIRPQKCPCPCHLSRCQTQGPVFCLLLTSQQHDHSMPQTLSFLICWICWLLFLLSLCLLFIDSFLPDCRVTVS